MKISFMIFYLKVFLDVGFARTNTINSIYKGPNINWVKELDDKYCGLGSLGIANEYKKLGFEIYKKYLTLEKKV